MHSLGVNELVFGKYRSLDEILGEYQRVKPEGVRALLDEGLKFDSLGVTVMGPMPEKPIVEWIEKQRLMGRIRKKRKKGG
jgi:hypothetical protein